MDGVIFVKENIVKNTLKLKNIIPGVLAIVLTAFSTQTFSGELKTLGYNG